ncbi:hypothetical protein JCM19238_1966 [Vibrio ponticus]|nr:hypothetical protein JCM19238_1966 [Vibrio ponticus]
MGEAPLFTWMSAGGIELFGVNEFAVRFPHWLAGVAVVILMANFARKCGYSGLVSSVVLATCAVFAISAGAVMTDMALTFGLALAMTGFYRCWLGQRVWGYVGFVGLAIGLLAKGPLVIVLMSLAVVPWLILQHGVIGAWRVLYQRFPLLSGSLLMLLIAAPWYLLAEQATPGFLDYFIVGEHFKRFLVSGWQGDLYGTAHDEPRGTIWLFWLYAAAPWSFVLPILMWKKRAVLKQAELQQSGLFSFLLCWMLSPLLLFTLSGNILPAYVLPGIPAIGVMIAMLLGDPQHDPKWFKGCAAVVPVLLVAALVVINVSVGNKKSDKVIFAQADPNVPTFYVGTRPFSGQFYSQGKALELGDLSLPLQLPKFQLIGRKDQVAQLVEAQALNCVVEYTAKSKRSLYRCRPSS